MATIDVSATDAARRIALQMLQERGRGAVLVGVARVDAALEHLLQALMAPAARCQLRRRFSLPAVPMLLYETFHD